MRSLFGKHKLGTQIFLQSSFIQRGSHTFLFPTFIFHSSRGLEIQDQDMENSMPGESAFVVSSRGEKRRAKGPSLFLLGLFKVTNPIHERRFMAYSSSKDLSLSLFWGEVGGTGV
jgi:hypothetical protein